MQEMTTKDQKSHNPFLMDPFELSGRGNTIKRYRSTIEFIGDHHLGAVLDIGERNPLTEQLEDRYGITIENTTVDLDLVPLSGTYDTVFCFEVIEHLMNPLHLMLQIRGVLKESGRLFMSTPKHKPHFLWGKYHFTEYDEKRLLALVARAGFRIIRFEEFRTMPFWWHFLGIRPLIRAFYNKVLILELTPALSHQGIQQIA